MKRQLTERDALDLIRATATRGVPNCINLNTIDGILADIVPSGKELGLPMDSVATRLGLNAFSYSVADVLNAIDTLTGPKETGRTLFVCGSCGEEVGDGEQNNGCCPHCGSRSLSPNGWCDDE